MSRLLLLLWCLLGMAQVLASPVVWKEGRWCVRPMAQAQASCSAWQPLKFPLQHQPSVNLDELIAVHLSFVMDALPSEPLGLYVPYLHQGAHVWLNGKLVAFLPGANGEREVRWERPLLWQVPPALLRPGVNQLMLEMSPGRDMHVVRMAQVEIGDWMALEHQRNIREFLVRGVPQLTVLMCGFLATFLGLVWLMRRKEVLYALLSAALALWGLRTATFLVESLSHESWVLWRATYHWATAGFIVVLTVFACHFAQVKVGRWIRLVVAWWFAGPLLLILGGVHWEPVINRYWTACLMPVGLFGVAQFFRALRQTQSLSAWFMCVAAMVAFAAGVHDFLLAAWPEKLAWMVGDWASRRLFLLHHAANLMLLCLAVVMTKRFVDTLRELSELNRTLAQKVREREEALDLAFKEKAQIMVAHATEEERQRIVLDMHDGLGSRLFTTLTRIERGVATSDEMSRSLRACIDDMRLLMDALSPGPLEWSAAFASFRHRWDENLQALGVNSRWQVPDDVLTAHLGPHQIMQVLQILQEALTNVIKHAQASSVGMAAWLMPEGGVMFEVLDDGRGMPEGAFRQGRGGGSMRRRAERLGGQWGIESGPSGTRVTLTVPASREPVKSGGQKSASSLI